MSLRRRKRAKKRSYEITLVQAHAVNSFDVLPLTRGRKSKIHININPGVLRCIVEAEEIFNKISDPQNKTNS